MSNCLPVNIMVIYLGWEWAKEVTFEGNKEGTDLFFHLFLFHTITRRET